MKFLKNWIFLLFLISFVSSMVGYYFLKIYDCGYSVFCYYLFSYTAPAIFYPFLALAIVFLILLFVPRAVSAWRKFAIWYVPLAAVLIGWPEGDPGSWNIGPTTEQTALWLGIVYVVVSAVIIMRTFFKERSK